MNPKTHERINGYFDGLLTDSEEADLNQWIKASPDNALHFARMSSLHDQLRGIMRARAEILPNPGVRVPAPAILPSSGPVTSRRLVRLAGGLAALAATLLVALGWIQSTRLNASTELNRLIEKSAQLPDRTYIIRNLDPQPEELRGRQPPIDGAILHVRSPDQYVLQRKFPDGRTFVTGCDGERNWSLPPTGVVRLSSNPMRFRGPLPGHQHGIPFVSLRSDLEQLREAYVLSSAGADASGHRGLMAEKRSPEYRGPNRVTLWYEPRSGVIHRMEFQGMPRARGGPDSVSVELMEQRVLAKDFFQHQSHHGNDRQVIEED